jgi:DNA-binding response OmpR family regulator
MTESERPVTVVVVDEAQDRRALLAVQLRAEGFQVKEAATGAEALTLATTQPSLMILDVDLPDIDGFEVCRRLKSESRTAGITVLQVSATHPDAGHRVRALDGGADGYLPLPVDRQELMATVRALLRIRRAESESASLRAITQLANAAAHEINNPLSVITGQLHFLAKDPAMPPERLVQMEEAAFRIREIVLQMLHLTRVELVSPQRDLPEMLDLDRSSRQSRAS